MTAAAFPGRGNLRVYRGDTFTAQAQFDTPQGTPMPLPETGWTAQLRRYPDAPNPVDITVDATEADRGCLTLTIPATATAAITYGDGVWDLQHATDTGHITTWLAGRVTITKDTTR